MQLADDLFLVGGGAFNGFGLSTSSDSHVYAVDAGEAILLVDCGMDDRGGLDAIFTNLRGHGLDPGHISHLAITHYHIDHCGGTGSLLDRTGARVIASAETIAAIQEGDTDRTGFALAQAGGFYPDHYRFRAVEDLAGITAARSVTVGSKLVTPIPAPGHCAGHQVYLVEGSAGPPGVRRPPTRTCRNHHGGRSGPYRPGSRSLPDPPPAAQLRLIPSIGRR